MKATRSSFGAFSSPPSVCSVSCVFFYFYFFLFSVCRFALYVSLSCSSVLVVLFSVLSFISVNQFKENKISKSNPILNNAIHE